MALVLRREVAEYLDRNWSEYQDFLSDQNKTEYLEGIRTTEWGGDQEIRVLSRLLNRQIVVYDVKPSNILTHVYGVELEHGGSHISQTGTKC